MKIEDIGLANLMTPREGLYSCGQPTPEQVEVMAGAGVKTVVTLRGPGECDWDERSLVESTGMRFHEIPVTGPGDLDAEQARRLAAVIDDPDNAPVVVHCGSGNRVGALYALKAFHCDECGPDAALEAGRRAGMTGLEPHIRQCLAGE